MKKQIVTLTAIAALSVGAASTASANSSYTVESGDTLWGISQENNVTVDQLMGWNGLSSDLIFPGQDFVLEAGKASEEKAPVGKASSTTTYTVKSGDTLWSISQDSNVSLDQLMGFNGLSSDLIFPGQTLDLKGNAAPKQASAPAPAKTAAPVQASAPAAATQQAGKEMTVSATAYTAYCAGCSGVTATGQDLRANPNQKVIAVDPTVIPLGSKVWVEGYGTAIAGDVGGAIKGNKIDVFIPSQSDALAWGRKNITIKVLD